MLFTQSCFMFHFMDKLLCAFLSAKFKETSSYLQESCTKYKYTQTVKNENHDPQERHVYSVEIF